MKRTAAYRFVSDICFYYAILSVFQPMLPMQGPMALFTAASFAVSLAAVYCPWAPLRFVLALLPGVAFLQAKADFLLIFPILAWLYLILVLTAGRFQIWLEGYRHSYRIMLTICLFTMGSSILANVIEPGFTLILPTMCYAMAFLSMGALAMRRMQMNAEMGLRWNLLNSAAVIGIPLLAAGCSALLWRILLRLEPVGDFLLLILKRFMAWLVRILFPIHPEQPEPTPTITPEPTLSPAEEAIAEPIWESPTPKPSFDLDLDPETLERARRIGIFVLLTLLAAAVVILIVYHARKNRAKAVQEDFLFEETEKGNLFRRRKKTEIISGPANARQIRFFYRKYMKLMRKRGVKISKGNTSREILAEAEPLCAYSSAERLRELYLKARYDDGDTVTPEDVQEAALCLWQIMKDGI